MENSINFKPAFEYKLIYVFRINDELHNNCLKIGDATINTDKNYNDLTPNSKDLAKAAENRINKYTSTAGIKYELIHTEIAVFKSTDRKSNNFGKLVAFRDYKVHEILKRSGIKIKVFDTNTKQNEWFQTDLETVKNAINAVKNEKNSLESNQITQAKDPIKFRPEQIDAISKTIQKFKTSKKMLWNAKMRFGKTLTALQVARKMEFSKTIVITHKPVVSESWFEDFGKVFYDRKDFTFGSKNKGKPISELITSNKKFVYFASIQDLRGSELVGGNFNKNEEIFGIEWDMLIIDEAHEGTKTNIGRNVINKLTGNNEKTRILELSGTPFNLLNDYDEDSIFTWDYIMEQESKNNWIINNFGDSNPYEELPKLNIFTYHLEKKLPVYLEVADKAFNFREFFRVFTGDFKKDLKNINNNDTIGNFIHEKDVLLFLNLLCSEQNDTNYPFSNKKFRDYFRHTLWVLPGVKEAKALSKLLKSHAIFSNFTIVNVAGDGDEEIDTNYALREVKSAITSNPNETYTITLTCGRLTTGVSIPEWTAVLMLSGTYSTSASQYLQTIFRVQTPASIDGKIKEQCYVFDFAPDRTLKMIADSVNLSTKSINKNFDSEKALARFLNYCPVVSIEESKMTQYKVTDLLQQLKRAYADRVANNGFDDPKIYNNELLRLTEKEIDEFEDLKKIIGVTKQTKKPSSIELNNQGFKNEELEYLEKIEKKKKNEELTKEEKEKLEEYNLKKKNREKAISLLRAISIRMPLLVYGMEKELSSDITIDNFSDNIDDSSWNEFMPKGVTRELFKKFSRYYDKEIFIGAANRIRLICKSADELEPHERVIRIAELIATFKNPDKETILTPWRVVNMQLNNTIGGYSFFDNNFEQIIKEPISRNINQVSDIVLNSKSKILEINSKTGLYPLYITYSIYNEILKKNKDNDLKAKLKIWDDIVKNQLFIICKTPMAKSITRRTLLGYRNNAINMHAFEDLIMQLKQKPKNFIEKVNSKKFWKIQGDGKMNFNAIIGNPPYQFMVSDDKPTATPIYNLFVNAAIEMNPDFISMIMPSRWMTGGKGLDDFRQGIINDKRIMYLYDFFDSKDCFNNVDIKGGVCYFLWSKNYSGKATIFTQYSKEKIIKSNRFLNTDNEGVFIRDFNLLKIKNKVWSSKQICFDVLVSRLEPYGLRSDFFKNPSKYGLPEVSNKPIENGIKIVGLNEKNQREIKYVIKDYPFPKKEGLNYFKVFIPESYGEGEIGEKIPDPIIAEPGSACTATFVQLGPFEKISEAKNAISYLNTKLFRLLVGIMKTTQHATRKVYKYVPLVDLNEHWNDDKIYKKFNITEEEIRYIDSIIK